VKEKLQTWIKKEYSPVIAAFVVLLLFKLCVILPLSSGPISFGDEALYKKYSFQWFTLGRQLETHYPPGYPLMLAPAFFFGQHWYTAMLVLNILYSSVVPVFLYLIPRLYLDRRKSICCMLIGCVIPFHFIMPTMILSENIFFPLLFLELWLVLRKYEKHPVMGDILIGFFLAFLCLSRYISIVTIPVFALVWLMKGLDEGTGFGKLLSRGCLIVTVMGVTYLPWILINYRNVPFKEILGFGIAGKTNPEQLTTSRLILTAVLYLRYFLLLAVPVLPTLLASIGKLDRKKLTGRYNQLWVLIAGLSGAFFVAVTRHSFRVAYNWPVFSRIMGRYLMCFPILFILLAFVTKYGEDGEKDAASGNVRLTGILSIFSIVLASLSYIADIGQIGGALYQGSAEQFLNFKGAMEGYKYVMYRVPYLLVGIGVMLLIHFVGFSKWKKYSLFACFIGLLLFEAAGTTDYIKVMTNFREEKGSASIAKMNELLASEFPPIVETPQPREDLVRLYFDMTEDATGINWEKWCVKFYGNHHYVKFTTKFEKIQDGEAYYVVTDMPEKYDAAHIVKVVGTFDRKGAQNTLMLVTK
jgi:hypothetical protein